MYKPGPGRALHPPFGPSVHALADSRGDNQINERISEQNE